MIKVQFPKSEVNYYWDGKEHDITPINLANINDSEYYYMDGYDNTYKFEMMTLLKREQYGFNKVPLDNYEYFGKTLGELRLNAVDVSLLNDKVGLSNEMTVDELRCELGLSKNKSMR